MPNPKKKVAKKASVKKKVAKPTYLREIQIKFRKKRVSADSPVGKPITDSRHVYQLFKDLENESKEKMIAISLDAKNKIICFEVVAIGSLKSIYVRPFECIRASLPLNPYGVILIHNHPSGDPTPSVADKTFTKELKKLTDAGGLAFHDHLIIGDEGYFSFADAELL